MFMRALILAVALVPSAFAQVAAPTLTPGQSWTYREINGYNGLQRGIVVREVTTAANGDIRVVSRSGEGKQLDEARFEQAGLLREGVLNDRARGVLTPALALYPFPLTEGRRWSQTVSRDDPEWREKRAVRVDGRVLGWETVRVPAGEFKALKIERRMWLGDRDPFRNETWRTETEWYVPELKAPAKLTVREQYREYQLVIGSFLPGEWYTLELTTHKPSS